MIGQGKQDFSFPFNLEYFFSEAYGVLNQFQEKERVRCESRVALFMLRLGWVALRQEWALKERSALFDRYRQVLYEHLNLAQAMAALIESQLGQHPELLQSFQRGGNLRRALRPFLLELKNIIQKEFLDPSSKELSKTCSESVAESYLPSSEHFPLQTCTASPSASTGDQTTFLAPLQKYFPHTTLNTADPCECQAIPELFPLYWLAYEFERPVPLTPDLLDKVKNDPKKSLAYLSLLKVELAHLKMKVAEIEVSSPALWENLLKAWREKVLDRVGELEKTCQSLCQTIKEGHTSSMSPSPPVTVAHPKVSLEGKFGHISDQEGNTLFWCDCTDVSDEQCRQCLDSFQNQLTQCQQNPAGGSSPADTEECLQKAPSPCPTLCTDFTKPTAAGLLHSTEMKNIQQCLQDKNVYQMGPSTTSCSPDDCRKYLRSGADAMLLHFGVHNLAGVCQYSDNKLGLSSLTPGPCAGCGLLRFCQCQAIQDEQKQTSVQGQCVYGGSLPSVININQFVQACLK